MRHTSMVNLKNQPKAKLHLSLHQPCRTSTQLARSNPTKPTTRSLAGVENLSKLPSTSMPRVSEPPKKSTPHHHHLRDRSLPPFPTPNPKAPNPPPKRKRPKTHKIHANTPQPLTWSTTHAPPREAWRRACARSKRTRARSMAAPDSHYTIAVQTLANPRMGAPIATSNDTWDSVLEE